MIAVLYFGLMQLLLIDSSRALNEAQRFRSRIVAGALAESGAELAAEQIVTRPGAVVSSSNFQGNMSGRMKSANGEFEIEAHGTSIGTMTQDATVFIKGTVNGTNITIETCEHTQ
ncbi:MAG: hypothetical protein ACXWHG_09120 [Thermoanaerobaculia bacterium]